MPWEEKSIMEQRQEFVVLAACEDANIRELCRRFRISPTTAYKWLKRHEDGGREGLADHSRRPANSPSSSHPNIEALILEARRTHPAWGARKLRRWLQDRGITGLPAPSTVHAILVRHGCITEAASATHTPWQRFEHAAPNDLWQMDFKGHFAAGSRRCHPLTVIDDHSRYVVCLGALDNEGLIDTQACLIRTFERYGLPWRLTMDNGSPWGEPGYYTRFELWLMRLGVKVSHSRPYHPQTQGKGERFHRTLDVELLQSKGFRDLAHAQQEFDTWLPVYNQERPHEALGMRAPVTRYAPSTRSYPGTLPALQYGPTDAVRKVQGKGEFSYMGKLYKLGKAFTGQCVAIRDTPCDYVRHVYYGSHHVASIDLREYTITTKKRQLK